MARVQEVKVPDIGDFKDVEIVEVIAKPGDEVQEEDPLITLESDKASMEVPAPFAGKVNEVKVKAGDRVSEGDLILLMEAGEVARRSSRPRPRACRNPTPIRSRRPEPEKARARRRAAQGGRRSQGCRGRACQPERPPPRARARGRPHADQGQRREGPDHQGRRQGASRRGSRGRAGAPAAGAGIPEIPAVDFSKFGEIETVPLSRIKKISGPHLHRAWLNVPQVTQADEADITELEAYRKELDAAAREQGYRVTLLAFLIKAAVSALRKYPDVNASLAPDKENLILKKYVHLGIAVDTPGGLVVPVVRDVDRKGVDQLSRELGEVSKKARDGKLGSAELQGASFTISSLGGIGGTGFTPLVNAPEVAILGVVRAKMAPVWDGSAFLPRLMLPVALSYDHRVVDGALAARFTRHLCHVLEDVRRLVL